MASNQLSCINGIFFYAKQIMNMVTNNDEHLSQRLMIFIALAQLVSAIFSGKLLDKYGRKIVFIRGQ